MSDHLHVITGATGLIGSHVAETLVERGRRVRALVRPSSNTQFLAQLGVELVVADLRSANSLADALAGAHTLYHCAAKVDDAGTWPMYQLEVIDTTRSVMQGASRAGVRRALHVSSMAAFGHPHFRGRKVNEEDPLQQNLRLWDYYSRAKAHSEFAAREAFPQVTIVRPSWSYGERERSVFTRIISTMRRGKAAMLGSGDNLLNLVYAGDIATGAIAAAERDEARGQSYNLASEGEITQREMYDLLASHLDLPRVTKRVPLPVAYCGAFGMEVFARLLHGPRPLITRHGISLICRSVQFSIEKARRELCWQPTMPAAEGIRRMLDWMQQPDQTTATVS